MRVSPLAIASSALLALSATSAIAQSGRAAATSADSTPDPIKIAVGRLDLERYKANIKGLAQFGDRRQGTKRNRDAVDWIEAQLKSTAARTPSASRTIISRRPATRSRTRSAAADAHGARAATPAARAAAGFAACATRTGVNNDSLAQPDPKIRASTCEPTTPGERQEVYCTKIGTTHPDEMYIVGGHMDGIGWGEAANDDGSGTALVMELARVFSSPDVQTDRSIRFMLWNNEETGLNGARAYVAAAAGAAGKRGSRRARGNTRSRSGSA